VPTSLIVLKTKYDDGTSLTSPFAYRTVNTLCDSYAYWQDGTQRERFTLPSLCFSRKTGVAVDFGYGECSNACGLCLIAIAELWRNRVPAST
jgi:hypothetical protein